MMKNCSLCDKSLPILDFYKSVGYKDGYTKRCKNCVKLKAREREVKLRSTKEGLEKERFRNREKYHKYNYKEKYKPSLEMSRQRTKEYRDKYPEKYKATTKCKRMKKKNKNNHLHHWSYNEEHQKNVIELSLNDHNKAHRFIIYDQERMMYRESDTGVLLDTKEKHLKYILNKINTEND